jgi:hypothetical protein
MRIAYENWNPGTDQLALVAQANSICANFQAQGYDLTLRQLYYQFVAGAIIPNNERSYKNLGNTIDRARLAGFLDWDYINDRTRNLESLGHWTSPGDILDTVADQFRVDHWTDQPTRIEVWVEKEALAGVIERVARRNDVSYFSCRGYVSQSEMWGAAQRLGQYINQGQNVVILHLGDHDPSGIDMSRDIEARLKKFIAGDAAQDILDEYQIEDQLVDLGNDCNLGYPDEPIEIRRIALNMAQVRQYNPPPNPAKLTDSRAGDYIARYGNSSWELDALSPATLDALIQSEIDGIVEPNDMAIKVAEVADGRSRLRLLSDRWTEVDAKWPAITTLLNQP